MIWCDSIAVTSVLNIKPVTTLSRHYVYVLSICLCVCVVTAVLKHQDGIRVLQSSVEFKHHLGSMFSACLSVRACVCVVTAVLIIKTVSVFFSPALSFSIILWCQPLLDCSRFSGTVTVTACMDMILNCLSNTPPPSAGRGLHNTRRTLLRSHTTGRPQDRAKRSEGCAPNGGAGGRARLRSVGAKPPRSWSINPFCLMVKAFSWIPKCKN